MSKSCVIIIAGWNYIYLGCDGSWVGGELHRGIRADR